MAVQQRPQRVVLVVDDDRDAREMLTEFLRFSGFTVETAGDGFTALALANRLHPGVILMDLSMPRMDGWEATRRLKADTNTRDIVVVAASAHAFTNDVATAFKAGCDGFIAKPLDLRVVAVTVEYALRRGISGLPDSVRQPSKH
jgi:CheY-like chemotaxis protein